MTSLSQKKESSWCQYFSLRPTKTRELLLETLSLSAGPQSVPDLQEAFASQRSFPNKTTLYREVEKLTSLGVLTKVQLSEKRVSYELSLDHHHHFVCQGCDAVTKISFCEGPLKEVERALGLLGKKVFRHNFELFGLCETCN